MNAQTPIEKVFRLNPEQKKALARLRITTVQDLLYHFPSRYSDLSQLSAIETAPLDMPVTLYGVISRLETKKSFASKVPMSTATLTDFTNQKIKVIWMHQSIAYGRLMDITRFWI